MIALCTLLYFATGALVARLLPGYHPARVVLMWPLVLITCAIEPDEVAYNEPDKHEPDKHPDHAHDTDGPPGGGG